MSQCKCSDCTKCPYPYCLDEEKDNGDVEYRQRSYYYRNRSKVLEKAKARREYRKAHGICVKCTNPATIGIYCAYHYEFTKKKRREYYHRQFLIKEES